MTIRGVTGLLAIAVVLPCVCAPVHAQSRVGGKLALSSQLVDRGLAITPATPVLQGSVSWSSPSGWSAGLAGGVQTRSPADPVVLVAQAARTWAPSRDWLAQASLLYYDYGSAAGGGRGIPDRAEAGVSLTYRDTVTAGLSVIHVAGRQDQRWLGAADAGASWPLARHVTLTAGAGVAQAVVRDYGRRGYYRRHAYYGRLQRYGYGNLGLAWSNGPWRLQVDRNATSLGTRRAYGGASASDWVATLSRSF